MAIPETLSIAVESLRGIERAEVVHGWTHIAELGKWFLTLRVRISDPNRKHLPPEVTCIILADSIYPWGAVTVYAAKQGGFTVTFPHQLYNQDGPAQVPWRTGEICVAATVRCLNRQGYGLGLDEPFTSEGRLRWVVSRLVEWLSAAARDELTRPGDPFELPDFPDTAYEQPRIVYSESQESLRTWSKISERNGIVELTEYSSPSNALIVSSFKNLSGNVVIRNDWGTELRERAKAGRNGLWIRLNSVPVLDPYQAPVTWDELRTAATRQGIDLDKLLGPLLRRIKPGIETVVLLGFPIPRVVGDPPMSMHWQPLKLPELPDGPINVRGFRKDSPEAREHVVRTILLAGKNVIQWLASGNWHKESISARGALSEALQRERTLIIGAGALGASIAELLVRGGVSQVTILDKDKLYQGNLVRHSLTMREVGMNKADATVAWLNTLSPHASVRHLAKNFPGSSVAERDEINTHSLIIDATAEDDTIYHLGHFGWNGEKLFCSVSLTYLARRLLFFGVCSSTFPHEAFRRIMTPWLQEERGRFAPDALPMEGLGCWHPVFPARVDDIRLMASVAVKCLEELVTLRPSEPKLVVAEQWSENNKFIGVRRIHSDW